MTATLPFLVQVVACASFFWIIYHIKVNRKFYRNAIQFPSFHPLIPSFLVAFLISPFKKFNVYQVFLSFLERKADINGGWLLTFFVAIRKPELLQKFFFSPQLANKSSDYELLGKLFGETGLLSAGGETFKTSKKVFLKSFMGSFQDKLNIENFYRGSEELINEFSNQEGWIKCIEIIKEVTAKNICRAALDIELKENNEIWKVLYGLEDLFKAGGINQTFKFELLPEKLSPYKKTVNDGIKIMRAFSNEVLTLKRKELTRFVENNEEPPNQFIYNLLKERADALDSVIEADITTLLIAALDTTAVTISLTLTMLGMNPEIQEMVFKEDQRIQDELDGKIMDESDFKKYEYLNRVIKETQRIFPPVPLIARNAATDMEIGKKIVPENTAVVLFMPFIHRDPDNFADPLKFDPDRFLPENVAKISKFAFTPFGMGPRQCPGMRYGMQSALFLVSSVIRKFKVVSKYNSVEELDKNMAGFVTISDKEEFPMRLEKRSHSLSTHEQ